MDFITIIIILVILTLCLAFIHAVKYDKKVESYKKVEEGKSIIIPPKFKTGGRIFQILEWIEILFYSTILIFLMVQFYHYLNLLATTCSTFYGFNPNYVHEWIGILAFPISMFIFAFLSLKDYLQIKPYKNQFYPSPDSQPEYKEIICQMVDDELLKKKKSEVIVNLVIAIFMFFIMLWSTVEPVFPISEANEAYQEECLIKIKK